MKQNKISCTVKKIVCILLLLVFCSWNFMMMLQDSFYVSKYSKWEKTQDVCNLLCGILLFIGVFIISKKGAKQVISIALGLFGIRICIYMGVMLSIVDDVCRHYDRDMSVYSKYCLYIGISSIILYILLLLNISALIINLFVKGYPRRTNIFIAMIGLIFCSKAILSALFANIFLDVSLLEWLKMNFVNTILNICLCITLFLLISMKKTADLQNAQTESDVLTLRLLQIKKLYETGKITEEQYSARKKEILDMNTSIRVSGADKRSFLFLRRIIICTRMLVEKLRV